MSKTVHFSSARVQYYFQNKLADVQKQLDPRYTIVLTDDNVFASHKDELTPYHTIIVPHGEHNKNQATVDYIITRLIDAGADRHTILVGFGGGVITDIAGYVAGIFMRGISFALVPTTILAMVDAAIGGKNGIDVGAYKNMVGLIRQPSFILFDFSLLDTLPANEWCNGFAEIIKHVCIKDKKMFEALKDHDLSNFKASRPMLAKLIKQNVMLKTKIVQNDELEQGERKLLNFGHTFGHAIENSHNLSHGEAISIGMNIACTISAQVLEFKHSDAVRQLIEQYGLPTTIAFDRDATLQLVAADKKKQGKKINFILLEKIGKAVIYPMQLDDLAKYI